MVRMATHERAVSDAFDRQAEAFERAPIQSNPLLLSDLVTVADFPAGAEILDAGCGPGLVAEALLRDARGYRVLGCDLSAQMVERARKRCAPFGDRARFEQRGLAPLAEDVAAGEGAPVEGAITRLVLHHVPDPDAFVGALVRTVRPGGVVLVVDHLADPDPELAEWHRRVEVMRDRTHAANLTGGRLVDIATAAGLDRLAYQEREIATDFEEWFARGTPSASREECRDHLLRPEGRRSRAWGARTMPDGNIRITGRLGIVRGEVPG